MHLVIALAKGQGRKGRSWQVNETGGTAVPTVFGDGMLNAKNMQERSRHAHVV